MSQEKVNRYKEEKRNRKEILAREKRKKMLNTVLAGVITVAFACWIGVSGYQVYQNSKPLETVYTDLTVLNEYMTNLDME